MAPAPQRTYFISRAGANKEWAIWIADALRAEGHDCFFQDDDIPPGSNFIDRINTGLARCTHLIALLSEPYLASEPCMAELTWALGKDLLGRRGMLLIVRLEDCATPPLAERHAAAGRAPRPPQPPRAHGLRPPPVARAHPGRAAELPRREPPDLRG